MRYGARRLKRLQRYPRSALSYFSIDVSIVSIARKKHAQYEIENRTRVCDLLLFILKIISIISFMQ